MTACGICNQTTRCSGDTRCWCFEYPAILSLNTSQCLCPACMEKLIKTSIGEYIIDLTDEKRKAIAELGQPVQLKEGIDYYINQNGYFVFTKWYHLRRGYCCGNGCLHCGWKEE